MSIHYKIRNVRSDVLLEVRITKGRKLFKHANLVKGAVAKGVVTEGAALQVREKNLRTGKTTPWETIIKGAPAQKKKRKKKPAKKKAKKSTAKKKGKKTLLQQIMEHDRLAARAEQRAARQSLRGELRKASVNRELAKRHREKKWKLVKEHRAAKKKGKKNPRKKKLPPAEWFYYRAAQLKKAGRAVDPDAAAAAIWWKAKPATRTRISKLVTAERAKGRGTVVTSRGKLTRKAVTGNVGKRAAAGIYKKIKPTKAEIAAAKKAARKNPCPPKRKK